MSIGAADLVSTYVSNPPVTAKVGATFKISDSTENRGKMASPVSVTRYYLSLDRIYGTGDRLLGARNVPALAPNTVSTGAVMVTIPTGTPVGTYFLLACADGTRVSIELNETNNCVASATAMSVGP